MIEKKDIIPITPDIRNDQTFLPEAQNITQSIYPKQIITQMAESANRAIDAGDCEWFKPVHIDFALTNDDIDELNPVLRNFYGQITNAITLQGHPEPRKPSEKSNMIIGFYNKPIVGPVETWKDTVPELEPALAIKASENFGVNDVLNKHFTAVLVIEDDIASKPKRIIEFYARMLMVRLGALKLIMINQKDGYYAFSTMEGGLATEKIGDPNAIKKIRDRLVTHACTKEAGSYEIAKNVIEEDQWQESQGPDSLVEVFNILGEMEYVPPPFEISEIASRRRTRQIQGIMGFSRQNESAALRWAWDITAPTEYRMGNATGICLATASGRFGTDKTNMDPDIDIVPVSLVPSGSDIDIAYKSLYAFDRYALGRTNQDMIRGPSIEFDEMAATVIFSPKIRVTRHPDGDGFRLDPEGNIVLPKLGAYIHLHQAIEEIKPMINLGVNAQSITEYIKPNFRNFPHAVGCGKDTMFAMSTDAASRSAVIREQDPRIVLSAYDAPNHGLNFLVWNQPLPGTDKIPDDLLKEVLIPLIHKDTGAIRLTKEIAQI